MPLSNLCVTQIVDVVTIFENPTAGFAIVHGEETMYRGNFNGFTIFACRRKNMSNNDWDPSAPPSSDLGATLTITAVFLAGAAATTAFVLLPALSQPTMGSTTSAKIQWQQRQQQFQKAIEEQENMSKKQDHNND